MQIKNRTNTFKSKKAKLVLAGIAALAILAVAITGLSRGAEKVPEETEETAVTVQTEKPLARGIQNTDELIGIIEPKDSAYVYPQISGEVEGVYVQAGENVSAGQVLCTIENNAQSSAASSVEAARISLQDAKANLERMQLLYESGGVSQEIYEQARSSYEQAQVQFNSASNAYGDQVNFSQVTAPIGGRVESFAIKAHDNVNSQTQICVIAGGADRIVKFSVTETIVNTLKTGDYIKVEKNGVAYDAVVTEISTMVNSTTGLFEVKAHVIKGDGLATNASVKVTLISEESSGGLTLPLDAIYYDGGNAYVYVYKDGIAHKLPVETGISSEERIEIVSGISTDDEVIMTWSSALRDGAEVMRKEPEAEK